MSLLHHDLSRHEFLLESGVNFAELARKNINLVVVRAELDYRYPLRSGDRFWIGLNFVQSSKVRFDFIQDIFRLPDNKLILNAKITGTALNERGRPFVPDELAKMVQSVV